MAAEVEWCWHPAVRSPRLGGAGWWPSEESQKAFGHCAASSAAITLPLLPAGLGESSGRGLPSPGSTFPWQGCGEQEATQAWEGSAVAAEEPHHAQG